MSAGIYKLWHGNSGWILLWGMILLNSTAVERMFAVITLVFRAMYLFTFERDLFERARRIDMCRFSRVELLTTRRCPHLGIISRRAILH